MLYERDYERQDIMNMFRFLDWILELPDALKQEFKADLKRYEQEKQMPYITSIERMGIEEGLQQGRQEGRQEGQRSTLLRQLNRKLGLLPESTIAQISQLSTEQLDELGDALLDFQRLEDLSTWLLNDR